LVQAEASIDGYQKVAVMALDAFTSLSKRRSKLAHGFFGIITDRKNQFAWRESSSAAKRLADGLSSNSMLPSPSPRIWIYTPKDFAELTQSCADTFDKIDLLTKLLPISHALTDRRPYGLAPSRAKIGC